MKYCCGVWRETAEGALGPKEAPGAGPETAGSRYGSPRIGGESGYFLHSTVLLSLHTSNCIGMHMYALQASHYFVFQFCYYAQMQ